MKRQPRWSQQGNCSRLSRSAASTAGTIQMPSTCSSESSSLPPSSGHQTVPLAWWGPCRKSVCRKERRWDCWHYMTLSALKFHWCNQLCLYHSRYWLKYFFMALKVFDWLKKCFKPFFFFFFLTVFNLFVLTWLAGMLAAQERLHGSQRGRCGVWRGALHSRNCGRLEPGQSDPGLQRVQSLHRWQPSAAGRLLNAVVDCKLPWCRSQAFFLFYKTLFHKHTGNWQDLYFSVCHAKHF